MYKVLIVEDHALIRFGLKTALETKEYISSIMEASTGEEAVDIIKNKGADAVIMDLGLPSMNGIEAAREIKKINKDIKILILTSHNSKTEVIDSIKAGASAYCSKEINPQTLADILLTVIEGALWFDSKVADVILNEMRTDTVKTFDLNDNYNLTDREKEVIKYMCDGLNNGDIAKILDMSVNTVKVHVSSIIQKLGVEDRTQVVVKMFNSLK